MFRFLTLLLIFFSLTTKANTELQAVTGEFPPYIGEGIKENGALSLILKEALAINKVSFKPIFVPWGRGFELVKQSKVDFSYAWLKTDERSSQVLFSRPIFYISNFFFYAKNKKFRLENHTKI